MMKPQVYKTIDGIKLFKLAGEDTWCMFTKSVVLSATLEKLVSLTEKLPHADLNLSDVELSTALHEYVQERKLQREEAKSIVKA